MNAARRLGDVRPTGSGVLVAFSSRAVGVVWDDLLVPADSSVDEAAAIALRRPVVMRGCDRILSGGRPRTMREQLDDLTVGGDLDALPRFYNDAPMVALEERVAELLGTPAAVFFPTGTMAKQVALVPAPNSPSVPCIALHPLGHQEMHERPAYAQLTGLRSICAADRAALSHRGRARRVGPTRRHVRRGTSAPRCRIRAARLGRAVAVAAAARTIGARVHLRRCPDLGVEPHSWTLPCRDRRTSPTHVRVVLQDARGHQRRRAGKYDRARRICPRVASPLWRSGPQQWPAALTALAGLDRELPRIPDYVRHARTVAAALASLPVPGSSQSHRTPTSSGSGCRSPRPLSTTRH